MSITYFVRVGVACAAALTLTPPAAAELPPNIEDLLTAQNR